MRLNLDYSKAMEIAIGIVILFLPFAVISDEEITAKWLFEQLTEAVRKIFR